jgi:hypothetical protein
MLIREKGKGVSEGQRQSGDVKEGDGSWEKERQGQGM